MSIGLVLSIAKDALAAQQSGVFVAGHNIANVNTPGYSRQSAVLQARKPSMYKGLNVGRGVNTTEFLRVSDKLIENRVMDEKSDLSAYQEMGNYMLTMEGIFNENSGNSLSALLGDFWNLWHDLSNNPSGDSERNALYEHAVTTSQQFNAADSDLAQLNTDLTNAMRSGIGRINEITAEIAELNNAIVSVELIAPANDLKDQRNVLASELAEYIDIKIFEQDNSSLTIITPAKGVLLVEGTDSYDLELDGSSVNWQGSGTHEVDITNDISVGKLGGWLEMRDEVVAKHRQDLTELASEFIYMVNQQHSQGIGTTPFSSLTGTYSSTDAGAAVSTAASGLDYYSKIGTGTFRVYVYDSTGALANAADITVTAGVTTLNNIATAITAVDADITATVNGDGQLAISTSNSHTFAFSNDTTNALAVLGVNTFFTGNTGGGMGVNSQIGSNKVFIAAAQISDTATGDYSTGDNSNALAVVDKQYTSTSILEWTYDRINGNSSTAVNATIEDYFHTFVGGLGIKASSIARGSEFHQVMVQEMTLLRESLSSVNLDEEMTDLIKFQHGFAAASKLIGVADEMFKELLSIR